MNLLVMLIMHCVQWTPEAVGEAFMMRALAQGYSYESPIATQYDASQAYIDGVKLYFGSEVSKGEESARLCAKWMSK